MYEKFKEFLSNELESIRASGLYKDERVIHSPQAANIKLADNREVLNFAPIITWDCLTILW